MSILGHPDVEKAARIFNKTIVKMSVEDLLFNYIVVEVDFSFNDNTKYPSIPCRVDDNVDIYPLKGTSIITGSEYLVAKSMGCRLFVKDGIIIPFKMNPKKNDDKSSNQEEEDSNAFLVEYNAFISDRIITPTEIPYLKFVKYYDLIIREIYNNPDVSRRGKDLLEILREQEIADSKVKNENENESENEVKPEKEKLNKETHSIFEYQAPFRGIVKDLQSKRRNYPKKTFYNYMYKEIGNSIYGQVAMGLSGKNSFDIRSESHVRVEGGVLSNPILASYITGFTRALIGECLNNIQQLGGKVISVTTDGFISNIEDLEEKLLSLDDDHIHCLKLYRSVRKLLTTFEDEPEKCDERAIEVKNIESLGIISWKTRGQLGFTHGGISAATGFQTKFLDKPFLIEEFSRLLQNSQNSFEYVQTGLRSATDIYKYDGNVIQKYKDRKYSLDYDNKRRVIDDKNSGLLDTKP